MFTIYQSGYKITFPFECYTKAISKDQIYPVQITAAVKDINDVSYGHAVPLINNCISSFIVVVTLANN